MWLLAEYLIGLLSVIHCLHFSDALDIDAYSDPCIAKILSCDWYRQPFSLDNEKDIGMFIKIEDLNKACKEQAAYMRCMVRAENFCKQTVLLPMAKEMIKSRRFPAEICRPASPWQQLYLNEASCLNSYSKKTFVHCIKKMIGIVDLNPDNIFERECKYGRAIIDCSTTELQEKCGYYAGNILKKIFKFHSLSDYKCLEFKPEEVEDDYFSSTQGYDITEAIDNAAAAAAFGEDFDYEATEGPDDMNKSFEGTKLDHLESQITSDDSISEEAFTIFDFNPPHAEESLTTEYSFFESLDSDEESKDMITEPDQYEFPALPKYHYIHKNRTTFALYEDLEMGHMKYMGCGEADVFWVILSPLRSKYCTLTDLKSEYSEAIFKCTVRIDAPCSPELDDEDKSKKAEVFYRRYVTTVLTPPNNQRSDDVAIMNVHYLKLYPSPTMYVPEKKVNLWTAQTNKANIDQTESIGRSGPLELEDDRSDILYQHGNGSGQKWDKDTMNFPIHSDKNEYYKEYENWDYYPLEEGDDIYFPELPTNNIIYIEDDKGELISLHDHRSPIYSNSVYQPHSLFRPRAGAMSASTDPQDFDEIRTNRKKLVQSSIFKERVSEFQDEALSSKVKPDQQEYCSVKEPCDTNSEFISGFEIKPGTYILSRNIKTVVPLKEMNQLLQKIPSSNKLDLGIDLKPFSYRDVYVVTPSAEIEESKSTESSQAEERYEDGFATDRSRYQPEEDGFATDRSRYQPEEDGFATDRSRYQPEEDGFATDRSRYQPEEDGFATDRSRYQPEEDGFATDRSRYQPEEDGFATDRSRYQPEEDGFATDRSRYQPEEDGFATDRSRYQPEEDGFATDRSRYQPEEDGFATDRSRYQPEEDGFATDRSRYQPEEDGFATDRSRYLPKDEAYDNVIDPDYISSVTSAPHSDSKIDCREPFSECYIDAFIQTPYKYLYKDSYTKVNPKDAIDPKNLKAVLSSEIESLLGGYLAKIIGNISKTLFKNTEKSLKWELLDKVFITLLEKAERI